MVGESTFTLMTRAADVIERQAKLLDQMLKTLRAYQHLTGEQAERIRDLESDLEKVNQQVIQLGTQLSHFLEAGEGKGT
jgi:hypothetical protein